MSDLEQNVTAWEAYWPGAGSIDSVTKVTRSAHVANDWKAAGAEITPLVPLRALEAALRQSPASVSPEAVAGPTALEVAREIAKGETGNYKLAYDKARRTIVVVPAVKCGICGGEHDNDLLSDICMACEGEAPWREQSPSSVSPVAVKVKARIDNKALAEAVRKTANNTLGSPESIEYILRHAIRYYLSAIETPAAAVKVASYERIIEIVQECVLRMQIAGESHQMLARWISTAIDAEMPAIETPAVPEGWIKSQGSRPRGLDPSDIVEIRRDGQRFGNHTVSRFNWDIWCEYRIVLPAASPTGGASSSASLAKGCCSAISPCAHQRQDPSTICEACAKVAAQPDGALVAACHVASVNWTLSGDQVLRLYRQVQGLLSRSAS